MFEITPDDIALLNDGDLRTLVGRLCESELSSRGLDAASITWGGHQNAADGGLDVRVALPHSAVIDGFVPRPSSGFQVKKPDMPRTKILAEMRPNGAVRPVIKELADNSGAYVIVSAAGSTSDSALQNRRKAMAEAVADLANANTLTLDFYDRTRLATWVRNHSGLVPWVRERAGKSIPGWRSYGPWAFAPGGVNDEYLLDDAVCIRTGQKEAEGGIPALEGIKRIRELLREPHGIVRLVGLSGVGKTRLIQALFDGRVGEGNLDPWLAIYTNMANEPQPQPIGLASELVAARKRAILVIDNCTPELHGRLSELCRTPESAMSVITVEYDIREDQPEGTEVFEMQPASNQLIEKLVKHRFPELSPIDARRITDLSGGNARIAIALAAAAGNDAIAGLNDEELFKRLYQQRHEQNESLFLAAQACSLVYSFQGEDVSGDECELARLGALIGKDAEEVFRGVAELLRRDLAQRRGVWRAVLPHAIANRLAALALQNIPLSTIQSHLVNKATERLLRSFSRRLGYLHASKEAVAIVRQWLAVGGLLENVASLNDLGRAMLENVAPVATEASLSAIERALLNSRDDNVAQSCERYLPLLRALAYDATSFERCIALILRIADASEGRKAKEVQDVFSSLFFLFLSGTHATIGQRLPVIESLLLSDHPKRRVLGLAALKAALQTGHFFAPYNFEFGARSRDYGYWPRTQDEVKEWFKLTLRLTTTLACSDGPTGALVRGALAEKFHGLWSAGMCDELEVTCRSIAQSQFWSDGWIAVRRTQHFSSDASTPELSQKLAALENLLRPRDIVQKVRSIVFSSMAATFDMDLEDGAEHQGTEDTQKRFERLEVTAESLGKTVVANEPILGELLVELVTSEGRLWSFGRGMALGASNPRAVWDRLVAQLAALPVEQRKMHIVCGFLQGLQTKDSGLVSLLLDEKVGSGALAPVYPMLETAVGIDAGGVDRLIRSLAIGKVPLWAYGNLRLGRATDSVSGTDFRKLILEIAAKDDGFSVASEILFMRLSSEKDKDQGYTPEVVDAGQELIRQIMFTRQDGPAPWRETNS